MQDVLKQLQIAEEQISAARKLLEEAEVGIAGLSAASAQMASLIQEGKKVSELATVRKTLLFKALLQAARICGKTEFKRQHASANASHDLTVVALDPLGSDDFFFRDITYFPGGLIPNCKVLVENFVHDCEYYRVCNHVLQELLRELRQIAEDNDSTAKSLAAMHETVKQLFELSGKQLTV